jgi:molecular chaperone GrpE
VRKEVRTKLKDVEFPQDGQPEPPVGEPQEPEVSEIDAAETSLPMVVAQRDTYLDQLQRSMAEFANYRKRVEQERLNARKIANRDLLANLVPIVDDFERALANLPDESADASWVEGVRLIERKLEGLLDREDVQQIDALGQPFDPALHEAVAVDPANMQSRVVEVYQNGYMHGDQLLRPAMVKVGNLAEPSDEPTSQENDNFLKGEIN